jgi:hypothetical protein
MSSKFEHPTLTPEEVRLRWPGALEAIPGFEESSDGFLFWVEAETLRGVYSPCPVRVEWDGQRWLESP